MCLVQYRTESNIFIEIMQNMKNATKQLNTSACHPRRADKLSVVAAARQLSKIFGGAHDLSAAAAAQGSSSTPYPNCPIIPSSN